MVTNNKLLSLLSSLPKDAKDALSKSGFSNTNDLICALFSHIESGVFDTDFETSDRISTLVNMLNVGTLLVFHEINSRFHNAETSFRRKELLLSLMFYSSIGATTFAKFSDIEKALFCGPWVRAMLGLTRSDNGKAIGFLLQLVSATKPHAMPTLVETIERCRTQMNVDVSQLDKIAAHFRVRSWDDVVGLFSTELIAH